MVKTIMAYTYDCPPKSQVRNTSAHLQQNVQQTYGCTWLFCWCFITGLDVFTKQSRFHIQKKQTDFFIDLNVQIFSLGYMLPT